MRDTWTSVDGYIAERLLGDDAVLSSTLRAADEADLPAIAVSAAQGRLLTLLAEVQQAERILEIGTLGGYSTICLARALPRHGRLTTLEIDARHAQVARQNVDRADLGHLVDIVVGPAIESLQRISDDGVEPFDVFFIDADKEHNADYFAWAVRLSRPGSLIIVDNVVRDGKVVDAGSADTAVVGTRRLFDLVASEPAISATAIQTVGDKGYDGFLLAVVSDL
jgi:predicted O-methyltransferase YrrM